MENNKGIIFNIQKFSIHDGPDIRDTVFMKGCPLRCVWCSNPESQSSRPEVSFNANKCIGKEKCGDCEKLCPQQAITLEETKKLNVDRSLCDACAICADACFPNALTIMGKEMTVDEVISATQNQMSSWRANGGITVSGGEPLMQADFVAEVLKRCQELCIHTAIETTGYASWASLNKVARYCDLIFYDVKILNSEKHQKYTGVKNQIILENLKHLSQKYPDKELIVRTPVIPGINDSEEDLKEIVAFLKTLDHLTDYELLPYHAFGSSKYAQLGREYELAGVKAPSKAEIQKRNQQFRKELFG
ncbi:MAG: glycyl-radical enzyme activating protein [Brotaphodocola sp.]